MIVFPIKGKEADAIALILDKEMAQLQVTVIEAKNLKKKDTLSENDPFVEIYLDNKHLKQKTKTKQDSKTPQWNQAFVL